MAFGVCVRVVAVRFTEEKSKQLSREQLVA